MKRSTFWMLSVVTAFAGVLVACGDGVGKGSDGVTNGVVPVNSVNNPYNQHLWTGTIQFTGGGLGVFQQLLKDRGICGGGYLNEWTGRNCDQWGSFAQVGFQISGNGQLPTNGVTYITAYSNGNYYAPYSFSFSARVDPVDSNSAFLMQVLNSGSGYNKYFRARGNVGTLVAVGGLKSEFRLTLSYNNQEIGYSDVRISY